MEKKSNLILGLDEVGVGAIAGPAYFIGVLAPTNWNLLGIKDSKKFKSNIKIRKIYNKIIEDKIQYKVVVISNEEIDQITLKVAHYKAYSEIIEHFRNFHPDRIVVDGNNKFGTGAEAIIGADNLFQTVSAASILGKVERDELMNKYHEQFPIYNFNFNKGYPDDEHRKIVYKFGICNLHRKSTSFINKIIKPHQASVSWMNRLKKIYGESYIIK